jgi:cell division protein FtsI/penicillin-binding protein 2
VFLRLVKVHADPDMQLSYEEQAHIGQVELRVPRGSIFDSDGEMLATDRQVFSMWVNPREVADAQMASMTLSKQLGLNEEETLSRLTRHDENGVMMKFVWVKRWLTEQDVAAYENMDDMLKTGLYLKKESIRYYPEGELAAHVIGYVNKDGVGCDGVEQTYDKHLRSKPGKFITRVDAKRTLLNSLTLESTDPEGGDSLQLTIDKATQRKLEREIDKALETSKAPQGMGIVVDVKTGAILAMACRPAFDPNDIGDINEQRYRNRAAEYVFEPGSSFKIVTASAALEQGLITPDTIIDCEGGSFNPYGHRVRDFHKLGVIPFSHCFAESSNIAIIKVGAMLGPERLEHWIGRYGMGRRTCTDFAMESTGIFRPRSKWSRLSMGSLPMGQEIAVTMPQLARAFCVIANGGYLRNLYVVERATDRDGNVTYQHPNDPGDRVLSDATVHTMRELCHLVVLEGTGQPANIPEFRVGGKTGTAQISRPGAKGFEPGKFTAVFAGFAPVSDPKICCVVVVQEPAIKLHFGGSICGPVFKEVVRDALIRMNCPPDPVVGGEGALKQPPEEEEDEDTVVARETPEMDSPAPNEASEPLDPLRLVATTQDPATGEAVLPSFVGLTKRQAKMQADQLGIGWDPQGAGRVVAQDPPPGTNLRDVTLCRLIFSNGQGEPKHETAADTNAPKS